ncbi:MAG: hypothetical protein KJ922_05000, partial [Nanoarchaeota archaeon]|nr:hypothetical protein [Nanoarchaeota archaeon]
NQMNNTNAHMNFISLMKKLTDRIYIDSSQAEGLILKVERMHTQRKGIVEERARYLLTKIKHHCKKINVLHQRALNLVGELEKHIAIIKGKLQSADLSALQRLKQTEYEFAKRVKNQILAIGRNGIKRAEAIYSEDQKAENLFVKLKEEVLKTAA